jgi:hypothetical protein
VIEVIAGKGTNAVGSPFAEVRPPFFPWKAPIAGVVKALLLNAIDKRRVCQLTDIFMTDSFCLPVNAGGLRNSETPRLSSKPSLAFLTN